MSEENFNNGKDRLNETSDESAEEWEKKWEIFRQSMDSLYSKIMDVNKPLLIKKNLDDKYKFATFTEAMDFTVTSNAISLIRGIYQNCLLSSTTALVARDVIEGLALIEMHKNGVITEEDEKLFLCQYALMEYDTYYKDGEKFKPILNLFDLTARYEKAKKIYNDAGVDGGAESGKMRRAIRSRVPFLCKHFQKGKRPDFNTLLSDYMPTMLEHYNTLSYYVHPNVNTATKSREDYLIAIRAVADAVAERYENYSTGVQPTVMDRSIKNVLNRLGLKTIPLSLHLEKVCNPANKNNAVTVKLRELEKSQEKILFGLAKDFEDTFRATYGRLPESEIIRPENNFITRFFQTLAEILYDVTFDYILKLRESVKIKFKVLAERFAHFDRVIAETINSRINIYGVTMLKFYELVNAVRRRGGNVPDDITPTVTKLICQTYRTNYPRDLDLHSPVYYDEKGQRDRSKEETDGLIMASFCKPLGNFLDGKGIVPQYVDLVREYFTKYYNSLFVLDKSDGVGDTPVPTSISASDYMDMLYRESNNMSHGCGYLYFANQGALSDDGPIMQALDNMIVLAVTALSDEITKWQTQHGQKALKSINIITSALLQNLNTASESLALIARQKTMLYQSRPQ